MNIWVTLAASALTGLTLFVSLGGFSKRESENDCQDNYNSSDEIPDEILDGPIETPRVKKNLSEMRYRTERNVRNFQDSLNRISNIAGNLSSVMTSLLRIFYSDSYEERITPNTIIF